MPIGIDCKFLGGFTKIQTLDNIIAADWCIERKYATDSQIGYSKKYATDSQIGV